MFVSIASKQSWRMAPTVPTRASILQKEKILPGIRVRRNSIITHKKARQEIGWVKSQTNGLLKWKMKRRCGKRWMAGTVFSSMKRNYGDVYPQKFHNMAKEI